MAKLVKIRLRGSGLIIEVIPPVAIARVNGGTAEYVFPMDISENDLKAQTAAMGAAPETAVAKEQNPLKRKR